MLPFLVADMNIAVPVVRFLRIQVADNGPGIIEEALEKVFIPFFTTKQDGSGIGLSVSRQIMRLHRGTIGVQSKPNVETIFTLRF